MTDFNRKSFENSNAKDAKDAKDKNTSWWSNAVVYQVYPRSFQDSNGDGMGDIPGITSRLSYLADLGVDVIWLSPVYKSPQDDNGYDISDYQDIDPMFGTLEDMDELLARAHELGLKVIMDLVVNHTSDEHAWFKGSATRDGQHDDWYIWQDPREGFVGGEPGAEPNNWGSYFGGSAWQWVPERGQYFFHQFSKKQPDLNWENSDMRQAVYEMMNWWMDRGIDGFRMDVISLISKKYDENGLLPGVEGSLIEMREAGPDGYVNPFADCSDGPRLDEFLNEMHRAVFDGRDGYLTVGEAPGISTERAVTVTKPENRELDMLFLFEHVDINTYGPGGKWGVTEQPFRDVRPCFKKYESIAENGGWTSLFFCNHDQPRSVSRWGDDSSEEMRVRSAKALALILHMHKGTPYIYQGEELGMTNADYTTLDQFEDLESINMYHQLVGAGVLTPEEMMAGIKRVGRDNARTPMQWDDSKYAGFTAGKGESDGAGVDEGAKGGLSAEPWLGVNANKAVINAASQVNDSESVWSFYKRLIELRHESEVVALGDWKAIDEDSRDVYAFVRTLETGDGEGYAEAESEDSSSAEKLLVFGNMSGDEVEIPEQTLALLEEARAGQASENGREWDIAITNETDTVSLNEQLRAGTLNPWTAMAVRV
ncbi:alpha-glucosidase [Alloscardovia theropitheci]|uniref:Alpha-glucosidase n=1 Tax=Alloscardovia theropitheci TaxID=2496842 RepID=A0A4R0QSV5_9BIFI|nr:alpha-glucosidase [Alloscardovia theropitheci]TCD54568.1 alpha-glucosidase [Alloscardovia theropitheci]